MLTAVKRLVVNRMIVGLVGLILLYTVDRIGLGVATIGWTDLVGRLMVSLTIVYLRLQARLICLC